MHKYDKGFLIVASVHAFYKNSALMLLDTLDEHYPDCNVMIATIPEWEEEFREYDIVKEVRTDGPNQVRMKLWALQHTIFEKTCYIDADMHAMTDEVRRVWSLLDDDHDVAFTVIDPETGSTTAIFDTEGQQGIRDNDITKHLRYHGGFFLWWNNDRHPNAVKLMKEWWVKWGEINCNDEWWEQHPEIYLSNKSWDQFTLWWIMDRVIPGVKMQEIEGGPCPEMYRWNRNSYMHESTHQNLDPIFIHSVISRVKMAEHDNLFTVK